MQAWLEDFLEDERRLGVWRLREPDGFPVWAYFRPRAAQQRMRRAQRTAEPFHAPSTLRRHLSGPWRNHARSLFQLPRAEKAAFDAVFFTNVNLATTWPASGEVVDRIHEGYFNLCRRPLILQAAYHGRYTSYPRWAEGQYCSTTWFVGVRRYFEWRAMLSRWRPEDRIASEVVAQMFGDDDSPERVAGSLKRMRGARRFYAQFVQRVIAPRMERKLAFVTYACGLGQDGILTDALRRDGFVIAEAQHGVIGRDVVDYQYPPESEPGVIRGVLPDLLLTFGEQSAREASPLLDCRSVGHHYLSRFAPQSHGGDDPARASRGQPEILVVSQGGASRRLGEIAAALARAFPGRRVTLKSHPTEQTCPETLAAFRSCPNAKIEREANVYALLRDAPIIVGYYSLALLEAALFPGKRIFMLPNPYLPPQLGYTFTETSQLIDAIRSPDLGRPTLDVADHWSMDWDEPARAAVAELQRRLDARGRIDEPEAAPGEPAFNVRKSGQRSAQRRNS